MINIGAYVKGSNPNIDKAIECHDSILGFLKQGIDESTSFEEVKNMLAKSISI